MYTRKQALTLAKQLRTCPPPAIRQDSQHAEQVDAHNRICPFCTTFLKDEIQAWDDFVRHLASDFSDYLETPPPAPGQIRKLSPGLAHWENNYYYTPPDVLILSTDNIIITVAQIWPDTTLAGLGDLVVPKDLVQGVSELFIETWNIYSLESSFLGPCTGTVDKKVTQAVIQMDENPDFLPEWAIVTIPLKENDPRLFFRELEIETGYTFSAMAVPRLMAQVEHPQQTDAGIIEAVITQIKDKIPGISWDWAPKNIDECLAGVRFPDHALPMAAAEDDTLSITATYYRFDGNELISIEPVKCTIDHKSQSCDPFSVSGVLDTRSIDFNGNELKGFINDLAGRTLTACAVYFDPEQLRFMANFHRPLTANEQFSLVIVHKTATDNR